MSLLQAEASRRTEQNPAARSPPRAAKNPPKTPSSTAAPPALQFCWPVKAAKNTKLYGQPTWPPIIPGTRRKQLWWTKCLQLVGASSGWTGQERERPRKLEVSWITPEQRIAREALDRAAGYVRRPTAGPYPPPADELPNEPTAEATKELTPDPPPPAAHPAEVRPEIRNPKCEIPNPPAPTKIQHPTSNNLLYRYNKK